MRSGKYSVPPLLLIVLVNFIFISNLFCQNYIAQKLKNDVHNINQNGQSSALLNAGFLLMPIRNRGIFGETKLSYTRLNRSVNAKLSIQYLHALMIGGVLRGADSSEVRIIGRRYVSGLQPGRILAPGVAEDPGDPSVDRIWRIRRDIFEHPWDLDSQLRDDVASTFNIEVANVTDAMIEEVYNKYLQDWIDWPAENGAPFYDADGDGVYTPGFHTEPSTVLKVPNLRPQPGEQFISALHGDEPGLHDASQVVFFIANDLTPQDSAALANGVISKPIGLEMQFTAWAYSDNFELSNSTFHRTRFIYKGASDTGPNATVDSMLVAIFTDFDLGSAADDLVGFATDLQMGFAYNENIDDQDFLAENFAPVAAGVTLLAGPITKDPGSTAFWGTGTIAGYKNSPVYAFTHYGGPSSIAHTGYDDPNPDSWRYYWDWNLLRGFYEQPVNPPAKIIDPQGNVTRFSLSGDPIVKTGWLDEQGGDRRFLMSCGPFTMALGDTNEITYAITTGIGYDRLYSLKLTEEWAKIAKSFHQNGFNVPIPPPAPQISASSVGDKILLKWEFTGYPPDIADSWESHGHKIEGFKIYQINPEKRGENKQIAIIDKRNDISTVTDFVYDWETNVFGEKIVANGKNSGLKFHHFISADEISQEFFPTPLIKEQEYEFAISTYSVNPDPNSHPRSLESEFQYITVHFAPPELGERLNSNAGDSISVSHVAGQSEQSIAVTVIDPTMLTGNDYKLYFTRDNTGDLKWNFLNTSTNEFLFSGQNLNFPEYPMMIDGFGLQFPKQPNLGFKRLDEGTPVIIELANEAGPLPEHAWDWRGAPFSGNAVWHSLNASGFGDRYYLSTTTSGEKGLQINIAASANFDLEMRFTENGSTAIWQDASTGHVPFELWLVPHVPELQSPVRLIPRMYSGAGIPGVFSADFGPDGEIGSPAFDRIDFVLPVEGKTYADFITTIDNSGDAESIIGDSVLTGLLICDYDNNQLPPPPGTIIRFFTMRSFSEQDVFTFSTATLAPTRSDSLAKIDALNLINAVPNPYYGLFNPERLPANRFITFTHLPEKATIRIFNLAGVLVRMLEKNDQQIYLRWDINNEAGRPVGNGLYLAKIELPDLGVEKILKLAIVHK